MHLEDAEDVAAAAALWVGPSFVPLTAEDRLPSRHPGLSPTASPGSEVHLDASNAGAVAQVAEDAERVYLCAAPPVVRWTSDFEPLVRSVLEGLKQGTTLVFASNLA